MGGSVFSILGETFRLAGVKAVLVGGYAVISYKVQRTTFDIDFIMTAEDCKRIEGRILALGYQEFHRTEAFVQYKNSAVGLRDVDFLLSDGKTIARLVDGGHTVSIGGEEFVVPSPAHIVAMKLHALSQNPGREMKDLADIAAFARLGLIDPAAKDIVALFERYGAREYWCRIRDLGARDAH